MKSKFLPCLTLFGVIVLTMAYAQAVTYAASPSGNEPPLRVSEPVDAVVADLQAYIPQRMHEVGVPGLSIALIRDGQIAWTAGFGVANTITRRPVTADTAFEVASISKAVAAYTVLQLVQQGALSLDAPASSYLAAPWLPPSTYADRITPRHLLTHSSGLTNQVDPVSKNIAFPPGKTFSYSGVGFIYLQELIEQVTGRSLQEVARELVFQPLGMSLSSYVNDATVRPHLANGHVRYNWLLSNVAVPFAVLLAGTSLVEVVIQRLRKGRWVLSWQMLAAAYVIAAGLGLALAARLLGAGALKWLALSALWLGAVGVALVLLALAGRLVIRRLPASQDEMQTGRDLTIVWIIISALALLGLTAALTGPVPRGLPAPANAAYSLRATAGDLARFLIELSDPWFLTVDLATQMCRPQVTVNADNSWGLGIGIQHSHAGDAVWHGGDNADFHSMMVMYPAQGIGVVVLTNGDQGQAVAYDVAQRALGGKAEWSSSK
jgi:CubicO group peptidase (beta-lactamase class C family)